MRFLLALACVSLPVLTVAIVGRGHGRGEAPSGTPIVVELFTSEGCSSCPPADQLLAELDRRGNINGRPIVIMSEHVDYWDGLGWKDRFSSSRFTQRQTEYVRTLGINSAYTPQMVINGKTELVGNDATALEKALASQISSPAAVSVNISGTDADITVSNANPGSRVLLAVTENRLTTRVARGENGGRELHHEGVVRNLIDLGQVSSSSLTRKVPLKLASDWRRENLRIIALVQRSAGGPIDGAAVVNLQ